MVSLFSHAFEDALNWFDWSSRQADIIAHGIYVTSLGAKINLHVNNNDCCVGLCQISIEWPLVWRGIHKVLRHGRIQRCKVSFGTPTFYLWRPKVPPKFRFQQVQFQRARYTAYLPLYLPLAQLLPKGFFSQHQLIAVHTLIQGWAPAKGNLH